MRVVVSNISKAKMRFIFAAEQVDEIVTAIEAGRLTRGLKTNLAHNQHVKKIVESKTEPKKRPEVVLEQQESAEKPCPKCGSEMVLREAKKGKNIGNKFWGCTNYPKCRAMIEVDCCNNG